MSMDNDKHTELALFATEVDFSDSGILKNAYVICPHKKLNELVDTTSSLLSEHARTKPDIIAIDYPNGYDKEHPNAQALVLAHKDEILNSESEIVVLLAKGFEKFYGAVPGTLALKEGPLGPKDNRQHIWDQTTVEAPDPSQEYKNFKAELKKQGKKFFCLFHVGEELGEDKEVIAKNSIQYSQFSARRKPIEIIPLAAQDRSRNL